MQNQNMDVERDYQRVSKTFIAELQNENLRLVHSNRFLWGHLHAIDVTYRKFATQRLQLQKLNEELKLQLRARQQKLQEEERQRQYLEETVVTLNQRICVLEEQKQIMAECLDQQFSSEGEILIKSEQKQKEKQGMIEKMEQKSSGRKKMAPPQQQFSRLKKEKQNQQDRIQTQILFQIMRETFNLFPDSQTIVISQEHIDAMKGRFRLHPRWRDLSQTPQLSQKIRLYLKKIYKSDGVMFYNVSYLT